MLAGVHDTYVCINVAGLLVPNVGAATVTSSWSARLDKLLTTGSAVVSSRGQRQRQDPLRVTRAASGIVYSDLVMGAYAQRLG